MPPVLVRSSTPLRPAASPGGLLLPALLVTLFGSFASLSPGRAAAEPRTHTVIFRPGERGYAAAVDATISNQNARWTGGNGTTLTEGPLSCYRTGAKTEKDESYEVRALLRFGRLFLPTGARIKSAALTLTFDNWSKGGAIRGHYLKAEWDPASKRLGWRYRDDKSRWAEDGAAAPDRDVLKAPSLIITGFTGAGDETFTIPLDRAVVDRWVRDPAQNQGLLLSNETDGHVLRIHATEDPDVNRRPALSITYEGPPPPADAQATLSISGPPQLTPQAQTKTPSAATPTGPAPAPPVEASAAPRSTATPPMNWARMAPSGGHPRVLLVPAMLAALRERARKDDPAWRTLRASCAALRGPVEWPDGNDYPPWGGIGEGYQGEGYFDALLNLALCYQISLTLDPAAAQAYGQKGAEVLHKMSEPSGPHAINPLRDHGFGIRFFGIGMALGYDWLHPALPAAERARLQAAMARWLSEFDARGFARDHPQGNYFAAYYAAKALTGLVLSGESDLGLGEGQWRDFLSRLHNGMVQPYYAAHLRGGGWPEGWNYGPRGTMNMLLPALAARTARGVDLLHGGGAVRGPFTLAPEQAAYLMHFTWPDRRTVDDRGALHDGKNPSGASTLLFTFLSGVLHFLEDPIAPTFHAYARAVRTAQGDKVPPWLEFLFWYDGAQGGDIRRLPRSYLAPGMNMAAMRSSWEEDAVWASFTAGTYVGNPASGEQYFDQGSLAIVRGGRPLLCNAIGALVRHTPGTEDGRGYDNQIYDDIFNRGNRTLFNVFYVGQPRPYGQAAFQPHESRTRIAMYQDGEAGSDEVIVRGQDMEDMYRPGGRQRVVESWTRTVVYLRPSVFVISDRTQVAQQVARDQWMAFHFVGRPAAGKGGRFDVGGGASYAGAATMLLPVGLRTQVVDLFGRGKVHRLEVRPGDGESVQGWLSVFDAAAGPDKVRAARPIAVAAGTVRAGEIQGVHLRGGGEDDVVIFAADPDRRGEGEMHYLVPAGAARHRVLDLQPGAGYRVRVIPSGPGGKDHEVRISPGGGRPSSASGVLRFRVDKAGVVLP